MQPAVENIVALSMEADLAYRKNIIGRNCGIHPENRAKTVLTLSMHRALH